MIFSEVIRKFRFNFIHMVWTANVFELVTFLVLDELLGGFLCAFLISNCSYYSIFFFYFGIKNKGGKAWSFYEIWPNLLFFTAWITIMVHHKWDFFYCAWHFDVVWRNKVKKISDILLIFWIGLILHLKWHLVYSKIIVTHVILAFILKAVC